MFGVIAWQQSEESKAELVKIAGIDEEVFWSTYWRLRPAYDDGTFDGRAYWTAFAAEVDARLDVDALVDADLQSWSRIDPDMVDYVGRLRDRGTRLGLLSNITHELADEFERVHPWLSVFDVLGFSCRIGHAKPDQRAYRWCVDRLGVPASEILFVDDSATNVQAARAFGLRTHLFRTLPELREAVR